VGDAAVTRDEPATVKSAVPSSPKSRHSSRLEWVSLPLLLLLWQGAAMLLASRFLPTPIVVAQTITDQIAEGHLIADFGKTLFRAAVGFVAAMLMGTAIGLALGRLKIIDRIFAPWVVVGLNLPAIVIAISCYIWLGLTEFALILAVIINKTPLVITTIREGVRSFLPEYDELADAFQMPFWRRMRLIYTPQLVPFLLTAARTGLSLIWKIVLVFEVLGSDGGVGFRISVYFQFFDMTGILAYTSAFILVVVVLEYAFLRPFERRILRWRTEQQ